MKKFCVLVLFVASTFASKEDNAHCTGVKDGTFVSDETSCSHYFVCVNGEAKRGRCPDPFVINVRTQKCDYRDNVQCFDCPDKEIAAYPLAKSCTQYKLCFDGTPIVQECLDGLQFNKKSGKCDLAEKVDCTEDMCPPSNDPDHLVYIKSNTDCSRFFICMSGKPLPQQCADGLYFNPAKLACDRASNVKCTINNSTANFAPPIVQPMQRSSHLCPHDGTHFYPDTRNCDRYIVCMNGQSAIFSCADGLSYDTETQSCRLPELADCKA